MAPVTSIRPATTAIAPPIALRVVSTTAGRFTRIDATHTMAPTRTPTMTATQLQSTPRATTNPAPIGEADRGHRDDHGEREVRVGQRGEQQGEGEADDPAQHLAQEPVTAETGDQARAEGEADEGTPDGQHDPEPEVAAEAEDQAREDREDTQEEVGHAREGTRRSHLQAHPRGMIASWPRWHDAGAMLILGIILFGMLVGAGAQLILGRSGGRVDWTMAIVAGLVGSFVGGSVDQPAGR